MNSGPLPGIIPCCCCLPCTALYSEAWVVKLCLYGQNTAWYTARSAPAGYETDNNNWINAVNSAFSTVSVSWLTPTVTFGGNSYNMNYVKAVYATSHTIHGYQSVIGSSFSTSTITDTTFIFGSWWRSDNSVLPKSCQPSWFWGVYGTVAGGTYWIAFGAPVSGIGGISTPSSVVFDGTNPIPIYTRQTATTNCLGPDDTGTYFANGQELQFIPSFPVTFLADSSVQWGHAPLIAPALLSC